MPFAPISLVPLVQTPAFSLWHYRTGDTRAEVTTPGYFFAALARLRVGDVMIAEAVDALAILPVRSNGAVGTGINLDGAVAPIALTRSVAQTLRFVQQATTVVTTIILAPLIAGIIAGTSIPVQAQVIGPISQVRVTLRSAQGTVIPPVQIVDVAQGYVNTTLATPPVGNGYRIRLEDAGESGVRVTSRSFNILPDLRLVMTESGAKLVQEDGFALAQN